MSDELLMNPHPRAERLGERITELSEAIYNGNYDDERRLRVAISKLVIDGMQLGYDLGRAAEIAKQ